MLISAVLWVILLNYGSEARSPPFVKPVQTKLCGKFEEWRKCGPACPPTCDTLGESVCCVVRCVAGCYCRDGYIRDPKNNCVALDACPSPGIVRFQDLELIVSEGSKVAILTVVRVNGSHGRITVHWQVRGAPPPYSDLTGLLIFDDEVLLQTIRIPVTDNQVRDPDIVLNIELFQPSEKTLVEPRRGESKVIIKDNDMRPGYPEMESLSVSVSESTGEVSVRVVRIDGSDGQLTVSWKTLPGTAEAGVDFLSSSGKAIFEEGVIEQIVKIKINDDEVREGRETFRVELYDPSVGPGVLNFRNRGSRLSTLVNIEDDDMTPGYPEMAITEVRVSEAEGTVLIRVDRLDGEDGSITVKYKLEKGTAQPFFDYIPLSTDGLLVFPEGVKQQTITVKLVDDDLREQEESFFVKLFDASPGPGVIKFRARGTALVTEVFITDNDMIPGILELERDTHSVNERVEALRVWVQRVGGSDGEVRVLWRTVTGVAVANKDFVNASGELVFLEGENRKSFLVHIVDDSHREGTETFHVEIYDARPGSGVLNFKGLGSRTRTDITIQDDDMHPGQLVLESSTLEVLESAGTVNLAVNRIGGTDGQIRVHWRTVGEGAYFVSGTGELVFEEGQTRRDIFIRIVDNEIRNIGNRLFEVQLFDPAAGPGVVNFRGLGGITRTVINVKDDDMHPGQLVLESSTLEVLESAGTINLAVNRIGGTDGQIRVHWRTVGEGAYFVSGTGELVFEEGQTRRDISIRIVDNEIRNIGNRLFEVQLFDPAAGPGVVNFRGLGGITRAVINVKDDDIHPGQLELQNTTFSIVQGVPTVSVAVARIGGTDGRLVVRWRTIYSVATFVNVEGEIVFEEGVDRQLILVSKPAGDFEIELFDPRPGLEVIHFRGLGERAKTVVTLNKFLGVLDLEEPNYTVSEGAGSVTIGVVRSGGNNGEVHVHYRTVSRTAEEGRDYVGTIGELVFHPDQHLQFISIRILDDGVRESLETFELELTQATTDGIFDFKGLGSVVRTVVTITDDDRHAGVFDFNDSHVSTSVGSDIILRVLRREGTDGVVSIHWRTTGDADLREGVHYLGGRGTLEFGDGETERSFAIRILPGGWAGERRFSVGLFDPSEGGRLGPNSLLTVTIRAEKAAEPRIFFVNTTLEVSREADKAIFQVGRTEEASDQPLKFFIETLQYNGESSAISNVDYKNTRGALDFEPNSVRLNSMVKLLPNPNARTPLKVFLVRISQPFGNGGVIPGKDILMVILRDMGALTQVVRQETSVEVATNVRHEIPPPPPPPPPPPAEFRGGARHEATTCPPGLIFKECEPSCQKKCQGVNPPPPCHLTCVKGCFCPTGMLLDESTMRCVTECPVSKCPFGMTFNECAHACPETCPGLDFLNSPSCHRGGCIKGCYCPTGLVLDHTLKNCVSPLQCSRGHQGSSHRGLLGGIGGLQGQVQGGLQQVQGQVQGISQRGLPVGGLQVQGSVQGGGLLGGVGGGLLGG